MPLKTHDSLGRRNRFATVSTGKRVIRQPSDLHIIEALHRLGPQTTEAVFQLLHPLYRDKHSLLHRLKLLANEANSDYGGPILFRPSQQCRGAARPEQNNLVHDVHTRGERLLQRAGLWRELHPSTSGHEWKHDFMVSTIIASIAIAAKANSCHFLFPDEVVAEIKTTTFPVPRYDYVTKEGSIKAREGATLRPDGFFALKYKDGTKRIFLVEADCRTEPYRSDNLERKSHKHNILAYHALLKNREVRNPYFGDTRVGVLNVFTHPRAVQSAIEVHEELLEDAGAYMLYNVWEDFGDYFKPPPPRPDLFLKSWQRVRNAPAFISKAADFAAIRAVSYFPSSPCSRADVIPQERGSPD